MEQILGHSCEDFMSCFNFPYLLSVVWANDISVQRALHVGEGTIQEWRRCNQTFATGTYVYDLGKAFDYQKNLTKTGLQILLYSGDHDLVIPHISTEYWLSELEISLDEDWRPWYVGGQVAGYTMKYSNYGISTDLCHFKGKKALC
ncbi:hypothetical protein Pint_32883 [Pistacia integerrima]|uniref:Uncharacterized protein n=1 Tax=Pistacia integerrima TaxID=434235 RepID=A0ACC0X4S4_9ROSI|nr:hypothetical protein Pint_32883 [Pistacia integerrima]